VDGPARLSIPEKSLDDALAIFVGRFDQPREVSCPVEVASGGRSLSLLFERIETVSDCG
jgi:hypothetical protein